MASDRWARIKAIFEACLDHEPANRPAFLEEACRGDGELRASVEALLASDDKSTPFLEPLVHGAGLTLLSESVGAGAVERRVGNYRLVKMMGSGGMGTVYQAVRADGQYDQLVAVKVVKPGMATEDILRRFRQERQTLAGLNHPNIARLLDGGSVDDGSPYLVLEYIDGKPIHQYCDENYLSVVERLRMFRVVCSAVQHAHRSLIVHRDLKPGNILVTPDGLPKLVDFGISKILAGEGASELQTATGLAQRIMTPQYASPEQIRGESITTASDQYSLGVILYELLTGHHPYQVRSKAPREAEHLVCDVDPDTPSTAVSRIAEIRHDDGTTCRVTPESVSQARNTQPDKLRRQIHGDLDTIVMTAIQKDPAKRYASVEHLSEDIRRLLDGLPVLAQRDTFGYRSRKFVGRNKSLVLTALVVAVSLAVAVSSIAVGLHRTRAALRRAEAEAGNARVQARKAERINEFLQDMLSAADPYQEIEDITVRALLDKTAERVETELADEPDVRAAVHQTIGTTYMNLADYEKAEHHLQTALAIFQETLGPEHVDFAMSLNALAELLHTKGQTGEAEGLFRRSLAILRQLEEDSGVEGANVRYNLAILSKDQGKFDEAEKLGKESLEIHALILGEEHPHTLIARNSLAALYRIQGRFDEAEPLFLQVLEVSRRVWGEEHLRTLNTMNSLAVLYMAQDRIDEAEPLLVQVLEAHRRILGDEHPGTLLSISNVAELYRTLHDYDRAESLTLEALEARQRILGDEHPDTLTTLNNLALLFDNQGRYAEAESVYLRLLEACARVWGEEHPYTLTTTNNLARLYSRQDRHHEALPLFETVQATAPKVLPPDHPFLSGSKLEYGKCLIELDEFKTAEKELRESLRIRREVFPTDRELAAYTESLLGSCLTELGRFDEAEPLLIESSAVIKAVKGEDHQRTLDALQRIIDLYEAWGRPDKVGEYQQLRPAPVFDPSPAD